MISILLITTLLRSIKIFKSYCSSLAGVQSVQQYLTLSFCKVFFHFVIGNGLISRSAISSEDNFLVYILPPLLDGSLFVELLLKEVGDALIGFLREFVLFLVLDEGQVAVLEILWDDIAYKTCEIACAVPSVQQLLKFLPSALINQLQVIVLLVNQLPLDFIHSLLLR